MIEQEGRVRNAHFGSHIIFERPIRQTSPRISIGKQHEEENKNCFSAATRILCSYTPISLIHRRSKFCVRTGAAVRSLHGDRYQGEMLRWDGDCQNSTEFNLEFCVGWIPRSNFAWGQTLTSRSRLDFFHGDGKNTNFGWGPSPRIPMHPHAIFLPGDAWGNTWGGFVWVSETGVC